MDMPFGKASLSTPTSSLSDTFTLPSSLRSKPDPSGLTKSISKLSLRHARPVMTKELVDAETVNRLSQRFETRLKISENSTKTLLKSIKNNKRRQVEEAAPSPPQTESTTRRLVEKLRRKEREEMARIQKQLLLQKAQQKKIQIESFLPGQRRQYVQSLEQAVRERQQRIKQAHQMQMQREAERLEQERKVRLEAERRAKEEADRRAREEAARLAKVEAERRAREEAAKQAQDEAERKAKAEALAKSQALAAKQKADEEAEAKAKQEAEQKVEEEQKEVQPQDRLVAPTAASREQDIPDISTSLLPQAQLQSRAAKPYLQPCPELVGQILKNVAAWTAFEADMIKYKQSELKLDKPFFEQYQGGTKELIKTVGEAINRVANTVVRPDKKNPPEMIDMELQIYTDKLITRLIQLNVEFSHNPDVFKYAVYKLVTSFAQLKMAAQAKHKEPKTRHEGLIEFVVNIFDRLHFQMPQLFLKEMVLGFVAGRNNLFYPKNAQLADYGNNEIKWIEQRGYRVAGGKRESVTASITRLTIQSTIFFALHLSDAYIGRLFMMLSTLLCLQYTQPQAQVILHLLEMGGSRLIEVYGKAFVDQLTILKREFIVGFRAYLADPNGMAKEPQNKDQYLEEGDTGIRETGLELDKLARITDELLQQASQRP